MMSDRKFSNSHPPSSRDLCREKYLVPRSELGHSKVIKTLIQISSLTHFVINLAYTRHYSLSTTQRHELSL